MKQVAAARSLCHGTALHHAFSTPMHCISPYCQPKEASCLVIGSYQLFYHSDEFLYQVEVGAHYLVFFFSFPCSFSLTLQWSQSFTNASVISWIRPEHYCIRNSSLFTVEAPTSHWPHPDLLSAFLKHNTEFWIFQFYWSLYISELLNIFIFFLYLEPPMSLGRELE